PAPKNPRESSSPDSEIPAIQASEPATMTAAVTTAERMLPGAAMAPPFALPLLKRGGDTHFETRFFHSTCGAFLDYDFGAPPGELAVAQGARLAQYIAIVPPKGRG